MAFAVVCKSCRARFLLNDDLLRRKVAGRVVTVRCRQCHATIEVDASDLDPKAVADAKAVPEAEKTAAPKPAPKALKPTPSPPRPAAKSTLMGIGSPARPAAATELTALSPGFLNMDAPANVGQRGFPEPPPPPAAVEELTSGDWEITETPPLVKTDSAPESLDDFVEELPPSLPPPPDEELPSSTGTPSLQSLAHRDEPLPAKPRSDDFLANMSAAMNGGIMTGDAGGAPTIDVSTLGAAPSESANAPDIDLSQLDVPLAGKQTLPLFALGNDEPAEPAKLRPLPASPRPRPGLGEGSLSPAAVDRPPREAAATDSVRERKNVVAPGTRSVPPAAPAPRRSGLAAPVLLALAVAAGFLIWKRNQTHPAVLAQVEQPAPAAPAAEAPRTPTLAAEPAAPASASAEAPSSADDVTFETTPTAPTKPAPASAAAHDKPSSEAVPSSADKPVAEKPVAEKPASAASEAKPEPEKPAAKEPAPAPTTPGEPAGPFDRAAAAAALNSSAAQASSCRKEGDPSGVASVVITFAPSGRVTSANISGPPFAGTPTGGCIAAALRKARVPAFEGDRVTVSKTIVIQ
ncbi:MAG: MJ0042-type zinc finger domain-containing protein [Myxococcales bacterium]